MDIWAEIEGFEAPYKLTAIDYSASYELHQRFHFRAIRSIHRVPSNGYCIVERATRLKSEFLSLPGPEIARLKKERDDMFVQVEIPSITFSGDTQIEFVLENEIVRKSKILFLECTYITDDRPVARAREWGHIHLEEIVANAEAFRDVERLFLIHFSPRYAPDVVRRRLKERLPEWLWEKTEPCIGPPPQRRNRR